MRPMGKDSFATGAASSKRNFGDSPGIVLTSFGPIEECEFESQGYNQLTFQSSIGQDSEAVEIPLVSADTLAGE